MISKNKIKLINSLKYKKYRQLHKLFICEGKKIFQSLLTSNFDIEHIYITPQAVKHINLGNNNYTIITKEQMKKISSLKTPQGILAIVRMKDNVLNISDLMNDYTIVLDGIQDPGNLGTIIRTAAWFGLNNIICSLDTVDVYNPKVIQSSMGALFGLNIYYYDLRNLFTKIKQKIPIYGTFADGENIYKISIPKPALIVFGNEGNGIKPDLQHFFYKKLSIPAVNNSLYTDSLNVAVSAAIIMSNILKTQLCLL